MIIGDGIQTYEKAVLLGVPGQAPQRAGAEVDRLRIDAGAG
jgi:hypothetical protein